MLDIKMKKRKWYLLITKGYAIYKGQFVDKEKIEHKTHSTFDYKFKNARMYNKRNKKWFNVTYTLTIGVYKIREVREVRDEEHAIPLDIWVV